MPNKVTFGIKNVHYATFTTAQDGTITYNTPVAFPGAVSIGLDPLGEGTEFYADNMLYWAGAENSGYQGPFESAHVPDEFRVNILGDTISANGLLVENVDAIPQNFALLFEIDGDVRKRRVVLYNCSVQRPSIASETHTNTKTPNVPSMQITASPRPDGIVRAFSTDTTDQNVYDNWYNTVPVPGASALPQLTALTIGGSTLSPAFDGATTSYTAATSTSTGAITATGPDGADAGIMISVNGDSLTNGGTATFNEGVNSIVVTVTLNGVSNTYTVALTYTA